MNLFHLLSQIPHEQLQWLAEEFGLSSRTPSRRNLLTEVSEKYKDESFLSDLLSELDPDCRGLLRALVFFTPSKESRIKIPQSLVQAWCLRVSLEDRLRELYNRGLLFQEVNGEEGTVLFPVEIKRALRSIFLTFVQPALSTAEIVELVEPNVEMGIESLFHLLSALRHRRCRPTQTGAIHGKVYEFWKQRFGGAAPSEEWFHIVFSYALQKGLLILQRNYYRPTNKVTDWLKQPRMESLTDLWQYVLEFYILKDPHFQHFLIPLLSLEKDIQSPDQVPVIRWRDLIGVYSEKTSLESLHPDSKYTQYLHLIAALGCVVLDSYDFPQRITFTRTGLKLLFGLDREKEPEPPAHESCVLQANFELLVPPGIGYSTLWKIDQIAELIHRDILTQYRISQQSVLFAMRRGWTSEAVYSFLNEITDGRIPQNVLYHVDEWRNKYGQIQLKRIVLVECAGKNLADEIEHIPDVKTLLRDRIGERYFVIDESDAKKLHQTLLQYGYEPAAAIQMSEESARNTPSRNQ